MKFLFSSVLLFITTVCMATRPSTTEAQQEAVHRFIQDSWEKTVRFHTEDEGIRIGLPYKYTVPSISGAFQEMYYWDTYFTGEGLILDGHVDLAKNNADNMLYMVDRFDKMYNGNLTVFQNRSQPPYLSMMIASVYRKTSPSGAVSMLENLRKERPDVAVDALIGHVYYASQEFPQAAESYAKADRNALEMSQLREYVMALYFAQKYAESLEVAKFGLTKLPRDAAFNRLAFFNSTDLKDYNSALTYADALFNKSDSAKFSYYDYSYYGNAYNGLKDYPKAIEMYKKALEQEFDSDAKRAGVIKQLSDCYVENQDFTNAITTYNDYLKTLGTPSANDVAALAQLYIQFADTITDSTRNEMFKKAEQVYIDMEQKYPDAAEYVTFMRARVNSMMDPETTQGLAKPFYEKVVATIEPREEKTASDNARLVESYRYLGYYYLLQNDKDTFTSYMNKILEIDPENEMAKNALGALSGGAK